MNVVKTKKFSTLEVLSGNNFFLSDSEIPSSHGLEWSEREFARIFTTFPYDYIAKLSIHNRQSLKSIANQVDGKNFSSKVSSSQSLIYGEINNLKPIWIIFNIIRNHSNGSRELKKFYDLGSGIGKPVIAAALCASLIGTEEAIGIEVLPSLFDISITAKRLLEENCRIKVNFYLSSLLTDEIDWSDGDIIFANSTCYDKDLMEHLYFKSLKLKRGSYFITLTNQLPDDKQIFLLISEERYEMSWGMADFYIYIKKI